MEARMRHRHAEAIIAWAEGNPIQYKHYLSEGWRDCSGDPIWDAKSEYRIKPEKKPDVVRWIFVNKCMGYANRDTTTETPHIKATFDGETGKLKSAEVL
jgi:hypothetical protein